VGYSRSKKTLEKVLPLLEDLKSGKGTNWTINEHQSPEHFAYKIREALYVASIHPDEFPELARAAELMKIEIVDRRTVQAVFKPTSLMATGGLTQGVTTHGVQPGERGPVTLGGPQSAAAVVQAWHNAQPSNTPMRFPQANLDRDELLKLFEWCSKRTPPWFMFVGLNGELTIQPYSRDLDGLGWDPADEG
jgi:hypothetical protein